MSKIAFLYPGQGAQTVGMGQDFYEKDADAAALYDLASKRIDLDIPKLCFTANDRLDQTEYTQAAMVTTCLAMTRVLKKQGIMPDITAGLSLGEYAAIACAGGMEEEDAVELVRERGILMQHTVPTGEGTMCAVLAMDAEAIEQVIAPIDGVTIANYNCPGQIVITGRTSAVEEAAERLKAAGAKRTVMLNVSGPFHSGMLLPAGEKLAGKLATVAFHRLAVPYVTNVDASVVSPGEEDRIVPLLTRQISSPVRWMQSMETMKKEGVDIFVEIGPGRTLAGFLKKIDRSAKVYSVQTYEDALALKEACCKGELWNREK